MNDCASRLSGAAEVTTTKREVTQQALGDVRMYAFRFVSDKPVRVYLSTSAYGDRYVQDLVFDVFSTESVVLPADGFRLSLAALTTANVKWVIVPVDRATRSEVVFTVRLASGTYDSLVNTSLAPPVGAHSVFVYACSVGDDFTLQVMEDTNVIARVTRDEQPDRGVRLGMSNRVLLDAAGPVRVEYTIRA